MADVPPQRTGQSPECRGNPGLDDHHLHGQDRHVDRKPHDGVRRFALEAGDVEAIADKSGKASLVRDGQPVDPSANVPLLRALEVGILCNNATLSEEAEREDAAIGDPMEVALLSVGREAGLNREDMLRDAPRQDTEAFDSETKMMATFHRRSDHYRVACEQPPEAVLKVCLNVLSNEGNGLSPSRIATDGFIVAWSSPARDCECLRWRKRTWTRRTDNPTRTSRCWLLSVWWIPPRQDVRPTIEHCREAGIRIIDDHRRSSGHSPLRGRRLGFGSRRRGRGRRGPDIKEPESWSEQDRQRLREAAILARVDPKQKLDLVALYQQEGEIVAMTGDGVNDCAVP